MIDLKVINRVDLKNFHHKEKKPFFFFSHFRMEKYLYKMMDGNYTYGVNHFTIQVSQVVILYTSLKLTQGCMSVTSRNWENEASGPEKL